MVLHVLMWILHNINHKLWHSNGLNFTQASAVVSFYPLVCKSSHDLIVGGISKHMSHQRGLRIPPAVSIRFRFITSYPVN